MFVYDELLDREKLEEEKYLVIVITGMYTSVDRHKEITAEVKSWGFNPIGIYNPSHGKGVINLFQDAGRAFYGIYGQVSRKTKQGLNSCVKDVKETSPK